MNQPRAYGRTYRQLSGMPTDRDPTSPAPGPAVAPGRPPGQWVEVPAWYRISIVLGGDDGAQESGQVNLRPEVFMVRRITFATTGDTTKMLGESAIGSGVGSQQARSCEVLFADEFTNFFGKDPALVASIFGDSNGFLDFPSEILIQGKQTLNMTLRRLFWPGLLEEESAPETRWDFVFHGVGLLPASTGGYSGGL